MENDKWFIPKTFEDFEILAQKEAFSKYEKIGFPDEYRKEFENAIYLDITTKATNLLNKNQMVLDIGCGISDLPLKFIKTTEENSSQLYFLDGKFMLDQLPNSKHVIKVPGKFPNRDFISQHSGKFDVIIMYSVIQYIVFSGAFWETIDALLDLLAPKGQCLIGDIPNNSMRNRFFRSASGIEFHKKFMQNDSGPEIYEFKYPNQIIDDSIIFSILQRTRNQGFHSYVINQNESLPFANRREDILIVRP